MALPNTILNLLREPAPEFAFEITEAGIAWSKTGSPQPLFVPLEPGTISVSPLADNMHRADVFAEKVRAIVGGVSKKRRRAVLILPDYSARVAVLEFDNFPADPKEQLSLVRFRLKKSVPFDVESAAVSYHPQQVKGKGVDVIVIAAAMEIVARYEAPFRAAGLHPGLVTTSVTVMAELNTYPDISVMARLIGRRMTVAVLNGPTVKLVRSVELQDLSNEEILAVLFPTIAYVEDEMGDKPARLLLCGFGEGQSGWEQELQVPITQLESRFGTPTQYNAGLLGYLQSLGGGVKAA